MFEQPAELGVLTFRDTTGSVSRIALDQARPSVLQEAQPLRSFRSRRGQPHYSGIYWCATTKSHVPYESRLELARLLLADFDPKTDAIVSQPFLLEATVDGKATRHVPDFFLVDSGGLATVVNVKPPHRLSDPAVAEALGWANSILDGRGWRTEIWTGTDEVVLANVRFLAGCRMADRLERNLLDRVYGQVDDGATIDAVEARLASECAPAQVRPALLHLLWTGRLIADLSTPLGGSTVVRRAA